MPEEATMTAAVHLRAEQTKTQTQTQTAASSTDASIVEFLSLIHI